MARPRWAVPVGGSHLGGAGRGRTWCGRGRTVQRRPWRERRSGAAPGPGRFCGWCSSVRRLVSAREARGGRPVMRCPNNGPAAARGAAGTGAGGRGFPGGSSRSPGGGGYRVAASRSGSLPGWCRCRYRNRGCRGVAARDGAGARGRRRCVAREGARYRAAGPLVPGPRASHRPRSRERRLYREEEITAGGPGPPYTAITGY